LWSRRGYEVEEPLSWILALAALIFAFEGLRALNLSHLLSPTVVGVVIGFVFHELAHRSVARMYGMSASFIAFVPGLLLTFISGFLPIKIIAPGYVKIASLYVFPSSRGVLYSVAAGPLTNIVISVASLTLEHIIGYSWLLNPIAFVNAWIAFFNLLPIPPLDGSKIFALDRLLWIILFVASLALMAITSF